MTPSISNSAFRTLSDLPSPAIWVHNSSKADILVRLRRLPALKWLWASHFMVTGGDHER
jgi:hypothetical protein